MELELKIVGVENWIKIDLGEGILLRGQIVEVWVGGGWENKFVTEARTHGLFIANRCSQGINFFVYLSVGNNCFWAEGGHPDCRVWVSYGHTQRLVT